MRVALVLQYLGTDWNGWQSQPDGRTIQDVLEGALGTMHKCERVPVRGSARTDAGVHALMQVAHFDPPFPIPIDGLARGLNALLPESIRVNEALPVADDFHALASATGKEYRYRLWCGDVRPPLLAATTGRAPGPLDVGLMRQAAASMPGRRDFALFAKTGTDVTTTVRDLRRVEVHSSDDLVTFRFEADGFLRGTVRLLVGTLVDVGCRRLAPEAPEALLEGDATAGRVGAAAEASGLFLWRVDYPPGGPRPVAPPPAVW